MDTTMISTSNNLSRQRFSEFEALEGGIAPIVAVVCYLALLFTGVHNLDASIGVYAPDTESYKTFALLFDKIIEDYHGFGPSEKQPPVDLGEGKIHEFPPLDPKGKYIKSTRIRCGRALTGYPFNPCLTELNNPNQIIRGYILNAGILAVQKNYLEMERKLKQAFESFTDDDLKGKYYALDGMTKLTQDQLIADHFLFKEGDRHLQAANACRFWPKKAEPSVGDA
ncbi:unnamed protein product [Strongylus vulgaris]|uniref:arginine kinase n=1 Tax=Strongylus vulgaris TaxID=40348 RepID=A0A3P7IE62_STRVU|nr:unnamed protein product [Strongylus vulgaris]